MEQLISEVFAKLKTHAVTIFVSLAALVGVFALAHSNSGANLPQVEATSSASSDSTSSASSAGPTYASAIPTPEIVKSFSTGLGVQISQNDPSRGATFPDISSAVDIWSAPYVTLLIYPSADALSADNANFTQDFNNLNSDRSWESCLNVVALYPASMQSQVDTVTNAWCTSNNPNPTSADNSPTDTYSSITSHDWALISKNPDEHKGEKIHIFGQIDEFNSLTGTDKFLADTDGVNDLANGFWSSTYLESYMVGTQEMFSSLAKGDVFEADVTVDGSFSYQSAIGTQVVVKLQVDNISYIASAQ